MHVCSSTMYGRFPSSYTHTYVSIKYKTNLPVCRFRYVSINCRQNIKCPLWIYYENYTRVGGTALADVGRWGCPACISQRVGACMPDTHTPGKGLQCTNRKKNIAALYSEVPRVALCQQSVEAHLCRRNKPAVLKYCPRSLLPRLREICDAKWLLKYIHAIKYRKHCNYGKRCRWK